MRISIDKSIRDTKVIQKALDIAREYEMGNVHAKKLNRNGCLVISVGRRYRLINFPNKDVFNLVTHEKYNRMCTRGL